MIQIEDNDRLQIPTELPLLPVRDLVVFPDMIVPLFVNRPVSLSAVEQALASNRMLLLVAQRDSSAEDPGPQDLYEVGTVGIVVRMRRQEDDRLKLLIQGVRKARLEAVIQERPHLLARLRPILDLPLDEISTETEALMRTLREQLRSYARGQAALSPDVLSALEGISDPGRLADLVASHLPLAVPAAQQVLQMPDPIRRLRTVIDHLARELELASTQAHIERQVQEGMDRSQREYYLRQQLKHIRTELGESDDDELQELEQRIADSDLTAVARAEAVRQLKRLRKMHAESAEAATIRTYLEWLVELRWQQTSEDELDLVRAKRVLDEDHLGMQELKDRVLEHLAVQKLNPGQAAPVLCLIGPPGVGKTSLGRSIARALGRRFVRISLGGVRDEAEIRGHRRTYVGAMPGRIIQAIKQAGTANPVIALDEIDKVGRDLRGDPAAALLEVLDPEQNATFADHYLNLPFDLSRVMFIATGNRIDTIEPPLLDRMELLDVPGYTLAEKVGIAERHLVPRQQTRCGLKPDDLSLSSETLAELAERYTRESGLRQLEQAIGRLCRKAARRIAEGQPGPGRLAPADLRALLGPPRHHPLQAVESDAIGIVNGLAWTPAGGEVLQVEAAAMSGRGQLILTGQLGDVMKESAQAALSYTRSLDARRNQPDGPFAGQDIHIHIPAGAIPKDGPSAGVAITVGLVSLLTRIPVRCEVAMTGEISLRGRLLPVGGLREKVLAAVRAGLKRVIVPARNADDLDSIPAQLRERIEICQAETIEEALDWALLTSPFEGTDPVPRNRPVPDRAGRRNAATGGGA